MAQGQAQAVLSALTKDEAWPALPLAEWGDTRATLHMWMQMVGKVTLALIPNVNHCWAVALHVTPRGLVTLPVPYPRGVFTMEFDFIDHVLRFATSRGETKTMALAPRTVADFYREFMTILAALRINARIWPMPVEIANPIRFDQDTQHASYDPAYANRCWRILTSVTAVCEEFRARFIGKASPVHFFWGSFDIAASRFSGRRAPDRPGADSWTRESYSHEVSSGGWWPGQGGFDAPMFYAYSAPQPEGFGTASVRPSEAYYDAKMGEFLLPYNAVRNSPDPKSMLLDFLQSTYEAAANLAKWDRAALER
ncbi:MAG TPA: DUF5996 family protein [Candidatus Acidoferrales bacterium]|jgi:hypothetical protein|nr:DUF5996 family protein [Candidatus Acidoferrales bacterium]